MSRLVLLVLLAAPLARADIRFDQISVDDGLSATTVSAITQDVRGFLWIGTEGGLDRYDGYSIRTYRRDPDDPNSLSSSFIQALYSTPGGALWVATFGGGLNHLDPYSGHVVRFRHDPDDPHSLSSDQVLDVKPAGDGTLWVGTAAGLDRLDPRTGRARHYRIGGSAQAIRSIAVGEGGIVWLAKPDGAYRFDPTTGQIRNVAPSENGATALLLDKGETLWVGFPGEGLALVRPGSETPLRYGVGAAAGGLCHADVQSLLRDDEGVLWVATKGGGVCRFDEASGSFEPFRVDPDDPYALPSNAARTLFMDRSGLVWIGTWDEGLVKMRRTAFAHVAASPAQGFASSDVMSFAEAPDGTLWVGTYDAGLYQVDLATGAASRDAAWPAAIRDLGIRSLAYDARGALWVTAGAEGLYRRDPATGRFALVPFPEGVRIDGVLDLAVGPDSSIWIGAYGPGLCRADPDAVEITCPTTLWEGTRALRTGLAYSVFPDADGRVWVSLWGSGVDVVDPQRGRVASYTSDPDDPTSLAENSVASMMRDRSGRLWLATFGGGLNQFDPGLGPDGGFRHVTEADGLPNGTVYGALEDDDGALWLSTNRGLAVFDVGTREVTTFGVEDGLQGAEFNGGAFLRLTDGRMLFGGIRGFNVFDPATARARTPPPAVALTGLRVLGAPTDVPADYDDGITLPHNENAVTFEFAALDFTAPERNRYAYRLDGYEDTWIDAAGVRLAAFTNLAPGRYTFRVRAANSDGVWADDALVVPLTIRSAWWQTLWFRALALLATVGGSVLAVRYVSQRRLRAEVQRLETERQVQTERERISRDLHDHVGAQLSSLLAGVELAKLARKRAQTPVQLPPGVGDPLESVESDARETMRQLRETIWALHDEAVTLGGFRDRLDEDLRQRLRGRDRPKATVTLEGDPALVLGPSQALHLFRIAREAATNALKHADADTLGVRLVEGDGRLTVEVADDGTFREADAAGRLGAGGYGMASMQTRAEELGGTFEVATDRGTTVRVTIPLAAARLPSEGDGSPMVLVGA